MMLIKNIGSIQGIVPAGVERLAGREMGTAPTSLADAWLMADGDKITGFGTMDACPDDCGDTIDAGGGYLYPAFCDSHTHIVYAGSRDGEFLDKINGLSYEEIARRGGGILNSADLLHSTSEDELYAQAKKRLDDVAGMGTGAIEIKSGYGLNTEDELKMLRVIRRLRDNSRVVVRSTFLGAHAVGRAYAGRQSQYVDLVCREMIPEVARHRLADYVDVFCDEGFFTVPETVKIMEAAASYGILPKIHANELANSGGVQAGVAHDALSVDHLERMEHAEIEVLKGSDTIATMLPGASFFSCLPYAPARRAVDAGVTVALASDYNPGSSPSGSMRFVMSLGCIRMKLTPAEALTATTLNGAAAMGLGGSMGSIAPGKRASFFITSPMPSAAYFPYAYTEPLIRTVFLGGKELEKRG